MASMAPIAQAMGCGVWLMADGTCLMAKGLMANGPTWVLRGYYYVLLMLIHAALNRYRRTSGFMLWTMVMNL